MVQVLGDGEHKVWGGALWQKKINLVFGKALSKTSWCSKVIKESYEKTKKPTTMSDDEWEEIKMKVSNIRLSLAPAVKYSVLNETFPEELGKKLEKVYMLKSLKNWLCLKKEMYQLCMEEGTEIINRPNVCNRLITQLSECGDYDDWWGGSSSVVINLAP